MSTPIKYRLTATMRPHGALGVGTLRQIDFEADPTMPLEEPAIAAMHAEGFELAYAEGRPGFNDVCHFSIRRWAGEETQL